MGQEWDKERPQEARLDEEEGRRREGEVLLQCKPTVEKEAGLGRLGA